MPVSHRLILLGFVILGGFCARAATYRAPLLDHHAWRQADTAAIARNFYRERFNILYPQIDQRGAQQQGYVATGMELLAFSVAAVSYVIGFHHETGRLLSALLFPGSCVLVFLFVRRRYGEEHGLVAAFLYAFGFPLLVFIERAFMNESLLIFLSLVCLVSAARYLERSAPAALATLIAASTLVAMIKPTYLIVWAPIAGLFIERYGWSAVRQPALWAMAAVNLAAGIAWYSHIYQLSTLTGLSFGLTDKFFDAATVFSAAFPARLAMRFAKDILGPVLLVAVAVGVWKAARERRWFEILGVAGYLAYLVIVAAGNFHHDYYQLALMPIAPALAAVGIIHLVDRYGSRNLRDTRLAAVLGLALLCTFVRHVSAHSWYEYFDEEVALCESLAARTAPHERIVFVGYNDPKFIFCADRKGWLLAERNGPRLDDAVRSGARLAVILRDGDGSEHTMLGNHRGALVFSNSQFDVFRLTE